MIKRNSIAGIILAAGASTRFGRPKQLLCLKGKYMIEWVLDAALSSRLDRIVLVLGDSHKKVLEALGQKLQHPKLTIEINPEFHRGQSHSLRAGLSKVKDGFAAVMFLLGDQPMINSAIINLLLETYQSAGKDICVPTYRGKRKNPTIFGHRLYGKLMEIKGDKGARELIDQNPDQVSIVDLDDPLIFLDIDTPQDFENLKKVFQAQLNAKS